MNDAKMIEVIARYEAFLNEEWPDVEGEEQRGSIARTNDVMFTQVKHVKAMFPKMREFLREGRREKVFRWIGFVQGWLWTWEFFTVEQLADHNKPDEPKPEAPKNDRPANARDNLSKGWL